MNTQRTQPTSTPQGTAGFQWPPLADCLVIGAQALMPLLLAGMLVVL